MNSRSIGGKIKDRIDLGVCFVKVFIRTWLLLGGFLPLLLDWLGAYLGYDIPHGISAIWLLLTTLLAALWTPFAVMRGREKEMLEEMQRLKERLEALEQTRLTVGTDTAHDDEIVSEIEKLNERIKSLQIELPPGYREELPEEVPDQLVDRKEEQRTILSYLKDSRTRLIIIYGLGGIGKTALAGYVLSDLRKRPTSILHFYVTKLFCFFRRVFNLGSSIAVVEDIIYLRDRETEYREITLDRIFAEAVERIEDSDKTKLRNILQDVNVSEVDKIKALYSQLDKHRYVILLDNLEGLISNGHGAGRSYKFEGELEKRQSHSLIWRVLRRNPLKQVPQQSDLITSPEELHASNEIKDEGLRKFIIVGLTRPRPPDGGTRLVITSRKWLNRPPRYETSFIPITLAKGLEENDAAKMLRNLDPYGDVGLKHADKALLRRAAQLTRGIPYALVLIERALREYPDLTLEKLLNQEDLYKGHVVKNLIEFAYKHLSDNDLQILKALAVLNAASLPEAIKATLKEHHPAVDVEGGLETLENNHHISRIGDKYELRKIDRDYLYQQLEGAANV